MKYSLKGGFVFFLLILLGNATSAQKAEGGELTKLIPVKLPEDYKTMPSGVISLPSAPRSKSAEGAIWIVFADRDNDTTYLDKNLTKKFTTANFMQVFMVAAETDLAVRIVRFDPSNQPFTDKGGRLEFKSTAEDYGWIDKRKLLLWSKALVDPVTKYSEKAISVKKLQENGDFTRLIKKGVMDLYNYPLAKKEYDNGKDIALFQYLFIIKEDKASNMYLLSKTNKIHPTTAIDDIIGWTVSDQIHKWNSAICLRVNFDAPAIEERRDKKVDVRFFRTPEQANKYRDGGAGDDCLPFIYTDPSKDGGEKDNPYLYGFPIIGSVPNNEKIFKTGYVTNTVDEKGKNVFTARTQAKYNQIFADLREKKEKVNIVFVLDGSARNFFKPLIQAISDNMYITNTDMTRNQYRLGAVIYNDMQCNEDERFKTMVLNSNKDNFVDKLNLEASKTPSCPLNRDNSGAPIYEAIVNACDLFPDSKSDNIIIMTGSVSEKDKSQKQAALDALIDKQVKMNFFQLSNKDGNLYNNYIFDCKNFMQNTADVIDKKFTEEIKEGKLSAAALVCPDECILQNSGVPGAFYFKDKGETFKTEEVNKRIKRLFIDNETKLNALISRYGQNTTGEGKGESEIADEEKKELMLMFKEGGISNEDIEKLATQKNFQLFIAAYAPLTTKSLVEPLLVRTLFTSREEFDRLADSFERLNESYTSSDNRKLVVDTYKEIVLQYKGGKIDQKDLGNFTLQDFMTLVTSLPNTTNKLLQHNLNSLQDPKKTTDDEITKLKQNMFNISKRLKDVKHNKLNVMEQDEDTFYWIPEKTFHIDD